MHVTLLVVSLLALPVVLITRGDPPASGMPVLWLLRVLAVTVGVDEVRVTASFGVAAFPESHSADELMTAADLALYSAKRHGKDRVVTVNPDTR